MILPLPDPITLIRSTFIAGIGVGIIFDRIPYLNTNFFVYGPRSAATNSSTKPTSSTTKHGLFDRILSLFSYPVPHSRFSHYYGLSLALSLFWGLNILIRSRLVLWICSLSSQTPERSIDWQRIWLLWILLVVQASRRLYECIALAKPKGSGKESTMPVSIYLIGLFYYILDSVGIWIEGAGTIANTPPPEMYQIWLGRYNLFSSPRTVLGLSLFVAASAVQHDCHIYLASLKKYTLPTHPYFQHIICPHYLAECIIYISVAILGAPKEEWVNKTVLCTAGFTTVILGMVARGTKEWTVDKFGKDNPGVRERWRMIPWLW